MSQMRSSSPMLSGSTKYTSEQPGIGVDAQRLGRQPRHLANSPLVNSGSGGTWFVTPFIIEVPPRDESSNRSAQRRVAHTSRYGPG